MKVVTYVEIDVPYCTRTYGVAPCTAAISTTGDRKCFNTKSTCQDRPNFNESTVTLRFSMHGAAYQPSDIEAIPCVTQIDHQPGEISLGGDLGQRATVNVTFKDLRHSDTGAGGDKYLADRAYNPYEQGTYWGKFRTRHRYIRGAAVRVIRGELGQSLGAMTTRHYVAEAFSGPTADGAFTLTCKDVLKLADNDRAKAPAVVDARLTADITNSATSITLTPSGIGNAAFAASGHVAIAGKEAVSFTRSGDVLTITRGQLGTTAIAHKQNDRVQPILRYVSQDPADIIHDLLVNYAGVDSSFIDLAAWQAETDAYLGVLYSANIAEPTGVRQLVSELVEQACLAIWWDDIGQKIRLQVLRSVPATADTFSQETNLLRGSLQISEQPEKRISDVWTYFDQRNPCEPLQEDNFKSIAVTTDLQRATDYGSPAIKKILSRWIPNGGRSIALRLNDIQLARYKDPPRRFGFDLFRGTQAALGGGYRLGAWALQDDQGAEELASIQVVRLMAKDTGLSVEAEEILFDIPESDLDARSLVLDTSQNNVNIRTLHDTIYPVISTVGSITLTVTVETGVIIGSISTGSPALDIGSFPSGLPITLIVKGRIQGAGGAGGAGTTSSSNGTGVAGAAGGPALYTRQAITLDVSAGAGEVWGGGGGGGGAWARTISGATGGGGGGGAGTVSGAGGAGGAFGGTAGVAGTAAAGGAGGGSVAGGAGGGPGLSGATGSFNSAGSAGGAGGAAGAAIDGVSYCTITGTGDRRGGEIN